MVHSRERLERHKTNDYLIVWNNDGVLYNSVQSVQTAKSNDCPKSNLSIKRESYESSNFRNFLFSLIDVPLKTLHSSDKKVELIKLRKHKVDRSFCVDNSVLIPSLRSKRKQVPMFYVVIWVDTTSTRYPEDYLSNYKRHVVLSISPSVFPP